MGYKSFHASNRQVGAIGKAIYEYTGAVPPEYKSKGVRYAYFYLVGEYNGLSWKLWSELKEALENLGLAEMDKRPG